jgi:PHS family inorganic phosphate transporter-like MFS transporter
MTLLSAIRSNFLFLIKLGIAFFANAYNLLVIDFVMSILDELNKEDPYGLGFGPSTNSLLASATSAGAIVGMVCFGFIADRLGRHLAVILTGLLVISGSVASSLCQRSERFPLVSQLLLFQTILGIGIGGEYPLSATIASECSDPKMRTRIVV